jgi:hypothetical protein
MLKFLPTIAENRIRLPFWRQKLSETAETYHMQFPTTFSGRARLKNENW